MAQNLPRGTPARVLVILTLLIGLVVVSAWRDALRRDRDTWVRFPTALGDTGLLQPGHLPVTLDTGGKTVLLTAGGPGLHRRDDRMFRVLTDAGTGLPFTLFTTKESLGTEEDPKLYARTAPHRFQRLRARLGPAATAGAPLTDPPSNPRPAPAELMESPPPTPPTPPMPSRSDPAAPFEADATDPDFAPPLPAKERIEDGKPVRKAIPVQDEEPFMEAPAADPAADPAISDKKGSISPKKGGL